MATASPCFRRDLAVVTVAEGELELVEVRDPAGRPIYRLYAFEHAVAELLDGRPWPALVDSVRESVGLDLTEQQLEAFASSLGELGLLDAQVAPADRPAERAPVRFGDEAEALGGEGEPTAVVRDLAALLATVDAAAKGSAAPAPTSSGADEPEPDDDERPAPPEPVAASEHTPLVELAPAAAASLTTDTPPPRAPIGTTPPPVPATSAVAGEPLPAFGAAPPAPAFAAAEPALVAAELPLPPTAPPRERGGLPRSVVWLLLAIAIGGALVAAWRFLGATARPLSVHTVVPAPASVHRWFDTYGTVRGIGAVELTATHGGRVVDVRPAGARFDAGAALVVFDGGRRVLAELRHVEERLAYYEKRREEMRAKHDRPEARQAEIKIAEKRRLIAAARAKLDEHAVVATTSGQVVAPLVSPGDDVAPGEAVLRIDGQQLQAVFDLSPEDAQRARALTFCRAELEGQGEVDCELANDGPEAGPVTVVLPSDAQPHPGQRVRLARARFDGVFTVPASAVVQVGRSERIFVAAPTGRAEARAVAVADRGPHDAIVTQGLDVGDAVIVDAPRSLRPNAPVAARAIAGPR